MNEHEFAIEDAKAKFISVMSKHNIEQVSISYSGGSDSDSILWLSRECGYNIPSVFFDTGIEYDATKRHIKHMIDNGFNINIINPSVSIPKSNKVYGQPFINKLVSEYISRLQKHEFNFLKSKCFNDDFSMFGNSKAALRWWHNEFGESSRFNINYNRMLKEFLLTTEINFNVSNKCCYYSKKLPAKKYAIENGVSLFVLGIRKSEGGTRSSAYKYCYHKSKTHTYDMYFPMFWWSNETKKYFDETREIKHSDCYEVYGLKRTGCAGCPFSQNLEEELESIKKFEPKLYKAVNNIFCQSYSLTRKYREFCNGNR